MNKKSLLTVLFIVSLVISTVLANRVIDFGFLTVAGGFACYALTYLATDVIGEIWGKDEANKLVMLGFVGQVLASILILFTGLLPAMSVGVDSAFHVLLGTNWLFTIASLLAYAVSQFLDVHIFHTLKSKYEWKWLRNNASTIISQLIDTMIFIVIGFGIGQGLLWNDIELLMALVAGQYIIKVVAALIDTPFFYLLTRKKA